MKKADRLRARNEKTMGRILRIVEKRLPGYFGGRVKTRRNPVVPRFREESFRHVEQIKMFINDDINALVAEANAWALDVRHANLYQVEALPKNGGFKLQANYSVKVPIADEYDD